MKGLKCLDCGEMIDIDGFGHLGDCGSCTPPTEPPCPSCAELREKLDTMRAKLAELDVWLAERAENWRHTYRSLNGQDFPTVRANAKGYENGCEATRERLRELNLIEEDTKCHD